MNITSLLMVVGIISLSGHAYGFEWLQTPNTLNHCVGEDVPFSWRYDPGDDRVTMLFCINAITEKTFLTYYIEAGNLKESIEYRGRTQFLEYTQEGATFLLRNVTKADTGGYILQLGGIGEKNQAQLSVYDESELVPKLQVNNQQHAFSHPLNLTSGQAPVLMVSTTRGLPANITITVDGEVKETCFKSSTCVHSMADTDVAAILFQVDYGICTVIEERLDVVVEGGLPLVPPTIDQSLSRVTGVHDDTTAILLTETGSSDHQSSGVVAVIVILLIVVIILIPCLLIFFLWYRRLKHKPQGQQPMDTVRGGTYTICSVVDDKLCCCGNSNGQKTNESLVGKNNPEDTTLIHDTYNTASAPAVVFDENECTNKDPLIPAGGKDKSSSKDIPDVEIKPSSLKGSSLASSSSGSSANTLDRTVSSISDSHLQSQTPDENNKPSTVLTVDPGTPSDKPVLASDSPVPAQRSSAKRLQPDVSKKKQKAKKNTQSRDMPRVNDQSKIMLGEAATKPLPDESDDEENQSDKGGQGPCEHSAPQSVNEASKDKPKHDASTEGVVNYQPKADAIKKPVGIALKVQPEGLYDDKSGPDGLNQSPPQPTTSLMSQPLDLSKKNTSQPTKPQSPVSKPIDLSKKHTSEAEPQDQQPMKSIANDNPMNGQQPAEALSNLYPMGSMPNGPTPSEDIINHNPKIPSQQPEVETETPIVNGPNTQQQEVETPMDQTPVVHGPNTQQQEGTPVNQNPTASMTNETQPVVNTDAEPKDHFNHNQSKGQTDSQTPPPLVNPLGLSDDDDVVMEADPRPGNDEVPWSLQGSIKQPIVHQPSGNALDTESLHGTNKQPMMHQHSGNDKDTESLHDSDEESKHLPPPAEYPHLPVNPQVLEQEMDNITDRFKLF